MKKIKIILDILLAISLFILLLLPSIVLFIICSIDTKQNGLFIQKRIGLKGKSFQIYKFRTIRGNYNTTLTSQDMIISRVGLFIRKYKLDEIPQLINILKMEMSFVGPRPDVAKYMDSLTHDEKIMLNVRPGITGPAQLKFYNETSLLSKQQNPQDYYDNVIWKQKVAINCLYVKNWSLKTDLYYTFITPFYLFYKKINNFEKNLNNN